MLMSRVSANPVRCRYSGRFKYKIHDILRIPPSQVPIGAFSSSTLSSTVVVKNTIPKLRKFFSQVQAEVVSNSRNKIHQPGNG